MGIDRYPLSGRFRVAVEFFSVLGWGHPEVTFEGLFKLRPASVPKPLTEGINRQLLACEELCGVLHLEKESKLAKVGANRLLKEEAKPARAARDELCRLHCSQAAQTLLQQW